MKTKKRLKEIENNNCTMGNILYRKFKKEGGGLEIAKTAQGCFNVALKAIKYRLIYKK